MINITLNNFQREVLDSKTPCLLKFSKKTCSLCKGLNSVFIRLQAHYGSAIRFATIDIDIYPQILDVFDIDGVPTIMVFIDGNAEELDFPEDPNFYSGYSESYLRDYIDSQIFKNDQE
jgi:thioredoxin 1|tara:strand:+ start:8210 stop:8563 length:354 start_codon:yes stop_codon:yes gene_type:complete